MYVLLYFLYCICRRIANYKFWRHWYLIPNVHLHRLVHAYVLLCFYEFFKKVANAVQVLCFKSSSLKLITRLHTTTRWKSPWSCIWFWPYVFTYLVSNYFKLAMLDRFEGSRWTAIQMQFQIGFELIVQTLISSKKSSNKVPPKLVANVWWLSLHKCQKPKGEKQQNKHETRDVPNLFFFRFFLFSFCWPFLWIYCAFTFNNLLFIYITLITWY